jgi:nitrate/TMAO reductase-like tetraheme cytochrome c subunit
MGSPKNYYSKYNRKYRKLNLKKEKERRRLYYAKYKYKERNKFLIERYGITYEQYMDMVKQQKNKCKICKRHRSTFKNTLNVDHDHITGKVRGLLCTSCNRGIGYLADSIKLLKEAIIYLQES